MGGGLVLLQALLQSGASRTQKLLIDARLPAHLAAASFGMQVSVIPRSLFSRISALNSLANRARVSDVLLCFNSLPPLRRSLAYVIIYVQAPHFVDNHTGIAYPLLTSMRHVVERLWFKQGIKHCDEVWVQTRSMADALIRTYPDCKVRIVPLVDEALFAGLDAQSPPLPPTNVSSFSFIYPADGVGHKNHIRLLCAWKQLADAGLTPRLILTLTPEELTAAVASAGISLAELPGVVNLGRLHRGAVLDQLRTSTALIFPSLTETFGLPLLEARMLGTPILASERDFVRDVCVPQQTFDPESPQSIAMAVQRFITGKHDVATSFYSAQKFVERLLSCVS